MIGGMSWESSKFYYELINRRVKELLGSPHSARSLMVSVDFDEIEKATFEGNWEAIGKMMAQCAKQLEDGGADIILLCTNTIHLVSDFITQNSTLPFLHIADATGNAIQTKQLKKVGLTGTRFTMEKDFYKEVLANKYGLEVIIPSEEERQTLQNMIYKELVNGVFTDSSKQQCIRIIENLKAAGAEGVILGCTEIPLLVTNDDVDLPLFDTAKIHAYQAVDWALAH